MHVRAKSVWTLLLVVVCSAPTRDVPRAPHAAPVALAPASPADPVAVRFGWPAGKKLHVEEDSTIDGQAAHASYDVVLVPAGGGFLLKRSTGTQTTTLDLGAEAQKAARTTTLQIDRAGRFVAAVDADAVLAAAGATIGRRPELDDATSARVQATLRTAGMRALVTGAARLTWESWVGAWVGLRIALDEEQSSMSPAPFAPEVAMQVTTRLDDHSKESVTFSRRAVLEGDSVGRVLARILATMGAPSGEDADLERLVSRARGSMVTTTTATIRPDTLQPLHVHSELRVVLQLLGRSVQKRTTTDARFTWR